MLLVPAVVRQFLCPPFCAVEKTWSCFHTHQICVGTKAGLWFDVQPRALKLWGKETLQNTAGRHLSSFVTIRSLHHKHGILY